MCCGVRPVDVEVGGQEYRPQVDEMEGNIGAVYDAPNRLREEAFWEEQRSQIVDRRAAFLHSFPDPYVLCLCIAPLLW